MTVSGSCWRNALKLSEAIWKSQSIIHPYAVRHAADSFSSRSCRHLSSCNRHYHLGYKSLSGEASDVVSNESTRIPTHESDDILRVYIVAGEPSGDAIGSRLMSSLRKLIADKIQRDSTHARNSHILDSQGSAGTGARSELAWGQNSGFASSASVCRNEREGNESIREGRCEGGMDRGKDIGAGMAVTKHWRDVRFAGVGG